MKRNQGEEVAEIDSNRSEPRQDPTWPSLRHPHCFRFLDSRKADIITLNEVSAEFFSKLLKEPWARSYWISELNVAHSGIGNCILSLFPIRASFIHTFRLSEKVNNVVEIVLPGTDNPTLWVSTAHLKAGPMATNGRFRRSQSTEMARQLEYLAPGDSPRIIMGDLNIRSAENETLQAFADWMDIWALLHPNEDGYTYNPWENDLAKMASERACALDARRTKMSNRYDRILTKGAAIKHQSIEILATESIGNIPDSENRLFISDHYALEATIELAV